MLRSFIRSIERFGIITLLFGLCITCFIMILIQTIMLSVFYFRPFCYDVLNTRTPPGLSVEILTPGYIGDHDDNFAADMKVGDVEERGKNL